MAQVTPSLINRFRAAGLAVNEMPGWQSRGEVDGPFDIKGILLHHDGEGLGNNNVPQYMCQNGVNGAQLWIKKDGAVFALAAGRKWHAGLGSGWGSIPADHGNSYLLGIETDHTFGQPWTDAQRRSILVVSQCAVAEYGIDVDRWVCGHKEYAPGRKPDPENFDLNGWRQQIKGAAPSPTPAPAPPPAEEDDMALFTDLEMFVQHVNYGVARALNVPSITSVDGKQYSVNAFLADIDRRIIALETRIFNRTPGSQSITDEVLYQTSAIIQPGLAGIAADAAEAKLRLRGGDTASGQKHENVDMLQGIDAQTSPKA